MEIYCIQLGMIIDLNYCLSVNEGVPCRNTIGCWRERTDIGAILVEKFTEDQLKKAFGSPAKSRLQRMVDSIESARKKG